MGKSMSDESRHIRFLPLWILAIVGLWTIPALAAPGSDPGLKKELDTFAEGLEQKEDKSLDAAVERLTE